MHEHTRALKQVRLVPSGVVEVTRTQRMGLVGGPGVEAAPCLEAKA